MKITTERVDELAKTGYFDNPNYAEAPACVAIMPFVKPEYIGVEIGVFQGDSSIIFLEHCSYMYFIDPCIEYAENPDKGWFTNEKNFLKRLMLYCGQFTFIKDFSTTASLQIPQVDFVFIDGNHTHKYIKQDIEIFWLKVKSGGFLSGHDYTNGHTDVIKAVNEFFGKLNLPIEQHQHCWLVRKP